MKRKARRKGDKDNTPRPVKLRRKGKWPSSEDEGLLSRLPQETALYIVEWMYEDILSIFRLSATSSAWYSLLLDNNLWKSIHARNWPILGELDGGDDWRSRTIQRLHAIKKEKKLERLSCQSIWEGVAKKMENREELKGRKMDEADYLQHIFKDGTCRLEKLKTIRRLSAQRQQLATRLREWDFRRTGRADDRKIGKKKKNPIEQEVSEGEISLFTRLSDNSYLSDVQAYSSQADYYVCKTYSITRVFFSLQSGLPISVEYKYHYVGGYDRCAKPSFFIKTHDREDQVCLISGMVILERHASDNDDDDDGYGVETVDIKFLMQRLLGDENSVHPQHFWAFLATLFIPGNDIPYVIKKVEEKKIEIRRPHR